jgi:hypothetical protein
MIVKEMQKSISMAAGGRRNFRISNTSVMNRIIE